MIKTVFFDLGGVVVNVDVDLLLRRLAEDSSGDVERVREVLFFSPQTRQYELGLISTREYSRWARQALALRMSEDQFVRTFSEIFTPNQQVVRLIEQLDGQLQVGVISNTNAAHYAWIARHIEPVPRMRPLILSFREHAAKPEPAIFAAALERAGCAAAEAVFIDDLEPNVHAARSLGIEALLYQGVQALVEQLQSLGVAVQ